MARQDVLGGRCGCIWCKTGSAPGPLDYWSWKRFYNKHGRIYGTHVKGHKKSKRQGK